MVCYRVDGQAEGGKTGERGGWEAGGRLNSSLGMFRLVMGSRSASHRPKHS